MPEPINLDRVVEAYRQQHVPARVPGSKLWDPCDCVYCGAELIETTRFADLHRKYICTECDAVHWGALIEEV